MCIVSCGYVEVWGLGVRNDVYIFCRVFYRLYILLFRKIMLIDTEKQDGGYDCN